MHENGKTRFSLEIFCITVRKKLWGTTSNFQNVWDLGNFYAYHGFSSIFLSHSTEKLLEETFNVSENFKCEVSEKNWNKNGISRFSVEIFRLRVLEDFVKEHFGISQKFGYRKNACLRG